MMLAKPQALRDHAQQKGPTQWADPLRSFSSPRAVGAVARISPRRSNTSMDNQTRPVGRSVRTRIVPGSAQLHTLMGGSGNE